MYEAKPNPGGLPRAVAYIRVSTDGQDTENQLPAIRALAAGRFNLVAIYRENESAWRAGHQRQLAQLLKDARRRDFKYVLVWALDRVSRQGPGVVFPIFNTLAESGVRLLSVQESWTDAPGPMYDLLLGIFAWYAKFESDRKSERVRAKLAQLRAQGKRLGRPLGAKDKRKRKRRKRVVLF